MNEGEKLKQFVMKSGLTVDEIIEKLKPAISRKTFFELYKKEEIPNKYYYIIKEIGFDVRFKPNAVGSPNPPVRPIILETVHVKGKKVKTLNANINIEGIELRPNIHTRNMRYMP